MRTNYVLIDFENLQPELLEALDLPHFRVIVFIGANQTRVPIDFAEMLQRLGERGRYIRVTGTGRNALDFHIAFYMGEIEAKEPGSYFHLITGDKGFEPLQKHLKDRKVFMRIYKSVADIPHVKATRSKSLPAKIDFVRESLAERGKARPATVKTLHSTIRSMFPGELAEEVVTGVVNALQSSGCLSVSGEKVSYSEG